MAVTDVWHNDFLDRLVKWAWRNKTHRILLYIAFVVTLSLIVQIFDVSLVGR